MVENHHLDTREVQTCKKDTVELYYDVIEIAMGGALTEIAEDAVKISALIPKMFSTTGDCRNLMSEDVSAIQNWADRS